MSDEDNEIDANDANDANDLPADDLHRGSSNPGSRTASEDVDAGIEQVALPDLSVDGVVRAGDLTPTSSSNTVSADSAQNPHNPDGPPSISDQVKSLAADREVFDESHVQQAERLVKEALPSVVVQLINIATGHGNQDVKLQADIGKYLLDRGLGRAVPANAEAGKTTLADLVEDLYAAQPDPVSVSSNPRTNSTNDSGTE